ncbi:SDR family NAD(P)-dependent oxidoreductase [Jiangella sp. DSM 45060]|uniref:SDR family NAD(P)-dependent oxidoreductase n=1 Tax=Jiangella sp. DSM 45060 TaxID=1798224 RepID=UPI0035167069
MRWARGWMTVTASWRTCGRTSRRAAGRRWSSRPIWPGPTPLARLAVDEWDRTLAVSLRGAFLSLRAEIPAMAASGGGAIVNVASTTGLEAVAGLAPYVAAKHGLIGLTKTAALDHAADGVRSTRSPPGRRTPRRWTARGRPPASGSPPPSPSTGSARRTRWPRPRPGRPDPDIGAGNCVRTRE